MKLKSYAAAVLCGTILMTGCARTVLQENPQTDPTNQTATAQESTACVTAPPSVQPTESEEPEKPDSAVPGSVPETVQTEHPELLDTWICEIGTEQGSQVYRLTFYEDGTVQMAVQNEIGIMLALYLGAWDVREDVLSMELLADPTVEEAMPRQTGGVYHFGLDKGLLSLEKLHHAGAVLPGSSEGAAVFESEHTRFEREQKEWEVCQVVVRYYEAVSGSPYPGYVEVDSRNEDGSWTIHLYEDLEDHVATAGWYTIDPVTWHGTDDLLGIEIDFSPYRE